MVQQAHLILLVVAVAAVNPGRCVYAVAFGHVWGSDDETVGRRGSADVSMVTMNAYTARAYHQNLSPGLLRTRRAMAGVACIPPRVV